MKPSPTAQWYRPQPDAGYSDKTGYPRGEFVPVSQGPGDDVQFGDGDGDYGPLGELTPVRDPVMAARDVKLWVWRQPFNPPSGIVELWAQPFDAVCLVPENAEELAKL